MTATTAIEILLLIAGGLAVRALVLHFGKKYLQRPIPGPRPDQRTSSTTRPTGKRH